MSQRYFLSSGISSIAGTKMKSFSDNLCILQKLRTYFARAFPKSVLDEVFELEKSKL